MQSSSSKKLLSKRQLKERFDNTDTTIQRWVASGLLPKPIYLGARPYWVEAEIDERVIGSAIAKRDARRVAA